ncbi:MAG: hypothetical protein ABRQ27_13050 [Clostridiaceae bacterium]
MKKISLIYPVAIKNRKLDDTYQKLGRGFRISVRKESLENLLMYKMI